MARSNLDWAVTCFRDVEKVELLVDKKRHQLTLAVSMLSDSDKEEYVRLTEQVRAEYEGKRETARRKGQVG